MHDLDPIQYAKTKFKQTNGTARQTTGQKEKSSHHKTTYVKWCLNCCTATGATAVDHNDSSVSINKAHKQGADRRSKSIGEYLHCDIHPDKPRQCDHIPLGIEGERELQPLSVAPVPRSLDP
jgi:Fe-S-cluster containining protein